MPRKAAQVADIAVPDERLPIQAKLPPIYRERLGVLAARTRQHQTELVQVALDLLFQQHRETLGMTNPADSAESTLKGA